MPLLVPVSCGPCGSVSICVLDNRLSSFLLQSITRRPLVFVDCTDWRCKNCVKDINCLTWISSWVWPWVLFIIRMCITKKVLRPGDVFKKCTCWIFAEVVDSCLTNVGHQNCWEIIKVIEVQSKFISRNLDWDQIVWLTATLTLRLLVMQTLS